MFSSLKTCFIIQDILRATGELMINIITLLEKIKKKSQEFDLGAIAYESEIQIKGFWLL